MENITPIKFYDFRLHVYLFEKKNEMGKNKTYQHRLLDIFW
jgi:hypothetical protein